MKEEQKDEYFYKIVRSIEEQNKKSFRRSILLSLLVVGLTLTMVYLAYSNLRTQQNEINKKVEKIESLTLENEKKEEAIIEVADAINYINESVSADELPDEARNRLSETKSKITEITEEIFNKYEVGDSLFVWSKSGLSMRAEPGIGGERIGSNNYGEFVKVLSKEEGEYTDTLLRNNKYIQDDLTIDGNWIKVQRGKMGYMFDGYLSKLPVLDPGQEQSFESYYRQFKNHRLFSDRCEMEYEKPGDRGEVLKISNISIPEAYLLARSIVPVEEKIGSSGTSFVKSFNKWAFGHPDFELTLEKKKRFVFISHKSL